MMLKTASIELARKYKETTIVGLHPGTVDTHLSEPFQQGVAEHKLFSAEQSAGYLLDVINTLDATDTGKVFDWAGEEIQP